jgi:hypothetical protein
MNEEIVRLKAEATQLLTKKGKPDLRRKEFSTPETTAKRVACAKKAGLSKLAKKAARDSQAEYAARLFNPAMHLLARIESEKLPCGISREVTKLCNDYFGEVRPCFKEFDK